MSSVNDTLPSATADDAPSSVDGAALDEPRQLLEQLAGTAPREWTRAQVQSLFTIAMRAYCDRLDADGAAGADGATGAAFAPLPEAADVTATDAVRTASAILEAVNLETFELALWQTWGGSPWRGKSGGPA